MITDDQIFSALRAFIVSILPEGTEVLQSQQNRTAQPIGPNYIEMTPTSRKFLSTSYRDKSEEPDTIDTTRSTQVGVQVDVYGPDGSDYAQRIATLFYDSYACDAMAPFAVQPLWCDDGQQMPLVNGEEQYEARWMLTCAMQANPAVSTPVQFASNVDLTSVELG